MFVLFFKMHIYVISVKDAICYSNTKHVMMHSASWESDILYIFCFNLQKSFQTLLFSQYFVSIKQVISIKTAPKRKLQLGKIKMFEYIGCILYTQVVYIGCIHRVYQTLKYLPKDMMATYFMLKLRKKKDIFYMD